MKIGLPLRQAVIRWDIATWVQALEFWDNFLPASLQGLQVLELGAGVGGLSLYFSLQGAEVICSDLHNPELQARPLHTRYGQHRICYQAQNCLKLELAAQSQDLVVFKSVLGGVGKNATDDPQSQMISEILRVLKPGGWLCFAENLTGTRAHQWLRKYFVPWSRGWRYLTLNQLHELMQPFEHWHYQTTGITSLCGRSEWTRQLLARLDQQLEPYLSEEARFCVMVAAQKKSS